MEQMNGKKEHRQEDPEGPKLDIFLDLTISSTHQSWDHEGETERKFSLPTRPSNQISSCHRQTKNEAVQKDTQRKKLDIVMHSTKPSLSHKQQTKEKVTQENTQEPLPKIELFIAILSAPHRRIRRIGLRQTWLSTVHNYPVAFKFFTDGQELSNETKHTLQLE